MLEYQTESTEGSSAEALSSESNLAVSMHVDKLDEAMTAVKAAATALHDSLQGRSHLVPV